MNKDTEQKTDGVSGDAAAPIGGASLGPEESAAKPTGDGTILLTEDQIKELQAKATKADEHWDRLLRMSAEFENFKKRAARDRQDAIRYANESVLEKLIPALDNFEMALTAVQTADAASVDALKTGINMVYQHLKSTLADVGLETLDASQGVFDPNWQEAVSQQESEAVPEGHVLQQLRKGYRLKDRLLRPAKVVVAKKPVVG